MRRRASGAWACGLLLSVAACSSAPASPGDAGVDLAAGGDLALDAGAGMDGGADGSPTGDARADGGPDVPIGPPLRVLFVGNSYTEVNDLPQVVRALGAATPGAAVEVEAIVRGGATLDDHWNSTGARARIEQGNLDAVVVQGQSLEPVYSSKEFAYNASLFSGALATAGARGVWFATWARRAGDAIYADGSTPATLTSQLELGYRLASRVNAGDVVARVGAAWQLALAELPDVALHIEDGSHPTAEGTLLAACVMLEALTGRAAVVPDPAPLGVPIDTARALCELAPRVRCFDDMDFCDGACVDVQYNPDHCGRCDRVCAAMDPCRDGVCGCDPGLTGCQRSCVDLQSDTQHCGGCDEVCAPAAVCDQGDCRCPSAGRLEISLDFAELSALQPECASDDSSGSLACDQAAHQHCAAQGCFTSGFGPPSGHAPTALAVMCVDGDVRATSYTALAAFVAGCDGLAERMGPSCSTAISRYCASVGAVTGFGPVQSAGGDELTVTCLADATVVPTTVTEVGMFASRCTPDPVICSTAAWNYCESLGHSGGFGPIEVSGDSATVICLGP